MWRPEQGAAAPSEVADPALRLLSTVRRRVLRSRIARLSRQSSVRLERMPALHRVRGGFKKDDKETSEPTRTERLLEQPVRFFPGRGADAHESLAVTVLFKCRGDRRLDMAYHVGKISAQLIVVALAGVGGAMAEGSSAALALVLSALVLQVSVFVWIIRACPSIDRIDNLVQAISWGAESGATTLLVVAATSDSRAVQLRLGALVFAFIGTGLPIAKLVYECLLAPFGSFVLRCSAERKARREEPNPDDELGDDEEAPPEPRKKGGCRACLLGLCPKKRTLLWMYRLCKTLLRRHAARCFGGCCADFDNVDMGVVDNMTTGTGLGDTAVANSTSAAATTDQAEVATTAVSEATGKEVEDEAEAQRRLSACSLPAISAGWLGPLAAKRAARELRTQAGTRSVSKEKASPNNLFYERARAEAEAGKTKPEASRSGTSGAQVAPSAEASSPSIGAPAEDALVRRASSLGAERSLAIAEGSEAAKLGGAGLAERTSLSERLGERTALRSSRSMSSMITGASPAASAPPAAGTAVAASVAGTSLATQVAADASALSSGKARLEESPMLAATAQGSAGGSGRLEVRETITREISFSSCVATTIFKETKTTVREGLDDAVPKEEEDMQRV